MSRPSQSARKKAECSISFEDCVDTLFEELAFAIQWQRPSILLAFCESKYLRADAELALEKRLAELGQAIVRVDVNEKQFDIPLLLSQRSDRSHSVYSVTGLSCGGGKKSANAYRALNIRREYFVDYSIRSIFWLSREEAAELAQYAPDFWVFRHRVVEFDAPSKTEHGALSVAEQVGDDHEFSEQGKSLDEQIAGCETLLAGLPQREEVVAKRLDLHDKLAGLYLEKGEFHKSITHLKRGANLALQFGGADLSAQFWGRLGLVHLDLNNPRSAIRAYWKAIRLTPQDAGRWSNLGQAYLAQGRAEAARGVFRKAIKYNPQDAIPWTGLGQAYHLLGRARDALNAYRKAVQFAPQDANVWNDLASSYIEVGYLQEALEAGNKAAALAPENALCWANLGLVYRLERNFAEAIIAYRQAVILAPSDLTAHASLVACYRLSGRNDLVKEQIKLVESLMMKESEYNKAVFESVCGNVDRAIDLLTIALEKKQAGVARLNHDPNLDFIRSDPRFDQLLKTGNSDSIQPTEFVS